MNKHRLFSAAALILTVLATAQMKVAAQTSSNGQFQILSLQPMFNPFVGSNGYVIMWNAATGLVNHLTYTESLGAPWQTLVGFSANSSPTTMVATDYPPVGTTQRFYQVEANIRPHIIMSLVLDRSASMVENGGSTALPPAVTNFIAQFDDNTDYASQVSFGSLATVDVPMTQPFIAKIQNAALALSFGPANATTCSDEGLTNGMAQVNSVTVPPGESVIKVIVFFTDGMANTFNYVFNCGSRDIDYNDGLYPSNTGCTIPPLLSSINPSNGVLTANAVSSTSCDAMHYEAENRAEWIAYQARALNYTIYCVGLGNTNFDTGGECYDGLFPVLNPVFLKDLANTPDSTTYDPSQPSGLSVIATDADQLDAVFQSIVQQLPTQ
jgi:hypothetical protein